MKFSKLFLFKFANKLNKCLFLIKLNGIIMACRKGTKHNREKSPKFKEYYQTNNPDWTEEQCKEAAKFYNKSNNYGSVEFYIKRNTDKTLEECEELRKTAIFESKKENKTKIEYYIFRHPDWTEEQCEEARYKYNRERNNQCIEYFRINHPDWTEEQCEEARNKSVKKRIDNRNLSGEHNGMHRSKTSEFKRRSISPRCIEFYQRKFPELTPEEQQQKLLDFFEYNRKRIKETVKSTNIEYYLNQGMSYHEAELALAERQRTFTLDKCIAKYGKEEGTKRFNERQEKWLKKVQKSFEKNGDGRPSKSAVANELITKICAQLKIDVPKHEKFLYDSINKRGYSYDFTYKNIIIEFNGDYWHCNPNFYDENYVNKTTGVSAKDKWEFDERKNQCAEEYGFSVLTIWENDYKEDSERVFSKCIEFIEKYMK